MISVIIPVYKNTEEFIANLRNNLFHLTNCEVIVVNDDPEKSIKKDLKTFNISLIENEKNLGFGSSVNIGVKKAKAKYVMLLNSDVVLRDSSFKKSLKKFEGDKNLFAVSFAQKEHDGSLVGKNKLFWETGVMKHAKASHLNAGLTSWAEGGTCMIDREKFLKLDGFDDLYSPFYWEDIDLSYRAWKAGHEIFFDPAITVEHHHESTIGKYFTNKEVKRFAFRNQHIFIIKNITDLPLLSSYWLLIIPNIIYYLLKGESQFLTGFVNALQLSFQIQQHRSKQKKYFILPDSKILSKFS